MKYKDAIQLNAGKIIKVGFIAEMCDCWVEICLDNIDTNHTNFIKYNYKHTVFRFYAAAGENVGKYKLKIYLYCSSL